MWQYQELEYHIEQQIRQYENAAEECIQELDDTEGGDRYLAKADALKDLLEWWNELRKMPKNKILEND